MITIKIIDEARKADVNIKNEPFPLFGRMLPRYNDGEWSYSIERFEKANITEDCFPDENYDYEQLRENSIFIGAYDEERCVGLIILQQAFFQYMYLYDFKVNAAYRGRHIGKMLIEKAKKVAKNQGYRGIYTQGQDNNLGACLFYLKNGFTIGGLDTSLYTGTPQEGKKDIVFYCDIK